MFSKCKTLKKVKRGSFFLIEIIRKIGGGTWFTHLSSPGDLMTVNSYCISILRVAKDQGNVTRECYSFVKVRKATDSQLIFWLQIQFSCSVFLDPLLPPMPELQAVL